MQKTIKTVIAKYFFDAKHITSVPVVTVFQQLSAVHEEP
jgi:hypothetical protein